MRYIDDGYWYFTERNGIYGINRIENFKFLREVKHIYWANIKSIQAIVINSLDDVLRPHAIPFLHYFYT